MKSKSKYNDVLIWVVENKKRIVDKVLGPHPKWESELVTKLKWEADKAVEAKLQALPHEIQKLCSQAKAIKEQADAGDRAALNAIDEAVAECERTKATQSLYGGWKGLGDPPKAKYRVATTLQFPVIGYRDRTIGYIDVLMDVTTFQLGLGNLTQIGPGIAHPTNGLLPEWKLERYYDHQLAFIICVGELDLARVMRKITQFGDCLPDYDFYVVSDCGDSVAARFLSEQGIGYVQYPTLDMLNPAEWTIKNSNR